ncbi:hypothetical protein VNO78_12182 [Psophocarpus tetragonolobus]|uniref:Transmembrane protein n=1 Tax=Psophocarpus tetragonolobus TaxID=3891 RepID=A0AAN9SMJ5_PSOTE
MASRSLNLWGILSESKRIINAHSRHFLALSVVFLLPLSFSLTVSPFLFSPSHSHSHIHILIRSSNLPRTLTLTLTLLLLSLCAVSSITHSVFLGFFGRPVKLLHTLFSILPSFLPLLTTFTLSHLLFFSLSLPLPLLLSFLPLTSPIFISASLLLLPTLIFLRVSLSLAPVISVVESSCGLRPLRRSFSLTAPMLPVALSSFLFFTSLQSLLLATTLLPLSPHPALLSLRFVLASSLLTILLLYHAAADTVLFMYCKAVHGELALDIAHEFAWQYFSLPFDDGKVPHVVSVVRV